ncbi:hypothetical protein LTR84_008090 [Exophiala bonariae]|uniref:Late embryogenesis abundant protein LEA-2 subgroup domain-containing protein n=1 Tax=Exophiala bonariae TaxID=1690606 RepID=A0AAV9NNJ9_9EURO|nr:hypothetical protein LTR84_008090 [Exophiala bonariae]
MAKEVVKQDGTTHVENDGTPKKASLGQKVKRHCARFWWLDLLIFIAVVLVIVLPIVYVGYPNLAQKEVNKGVLNITSMSLSDPAPDSFTLELDSVLSTTSKYHPELAAFNGSLHLKDSDPAFAYLDIPKVKAENGTVSHVDQRVQIADMTEYTKYTMTVLGTEEYSIYLKGRGGLQQGGLPKTNVNYNQKITLKGKSSLNSLKGFNLTSFNILTSEQEDGANANGTITIPNPTVLSVEMGTVTLDMSVAGTPVGVATIEDLVLKPGDNSFDMRAVTNQTTVVTMIFTDYKSGILPIDVVGKTAVFNNQSLGYYEKALQSNKLSFELDVIAALRRAGLADALGISNSTSKA